MANFSKQFALVISTLLLGVSGAYGKTLKKTFDPKALESAIQESENDQKVQKKRASKHRYNRVQEGNSGVTAVELYFTNYYGTAPGLESGSVLEAFGDDSSIADEKFEESDFGSELNDALNGLEEISDFEIQNEPDRDVAATN